jgi:hypothetical protein
MKVIVSGKRVTEGKIYLSFEMSHFSSQTELLFSVRQGWQKDILPQE